MDNNQVIDDLQDDLGADETIKKPEEDNELLTAEREAKAEEEFSDPIGARETGDELVDENEWQAKEIEKAVEGADDDVPFGMHIVGETTAPDEDLDDLNSI